MLRVAVFIGALILVPSLAAAQQPCTTDARRVVDEIYRHVLERAPDNGSTVWVERLMSGTTVREIVRGIAKSPEHLQRFGTENRDSVILYRCTAISSTVNPTRRVIGMRSIPPLGEASPS